MKILLIGDWDVSEHTGVSAIHRLNDGFQLVENGLSVPVPDWCHTIRFFDIGGCWKKDKESGIWFEGR